MAIIIRRSGANGAQLEQTVEGDITVGRGTDNDLQLSGLLVALKHLRLKPSSDLRLSVECVGGAGVTVNGMPGVRVAELVAGDELWVGTHRIQVAVDTSTSAQLVLELREPESGKESGPTDAVTSLAEAGWRMRRPAYWGLGLVILLLLVLPLSLRYVPMPAAVAAWLPTDRLWSSGQISNAHAHFGTQCSTCHEGLFQKVGDHSCLSCHAGITQHSDDKVAIHHAGLDQQRCASCHLEHGAERAVLPQHPVGCTNCHADPEQFPSLADHASVEDFGDAHPQFRVRVTAKVDDRYETIRQNLDGDVFDYSGLIFPHDLHLDLKGIRGPDGTEMMTCASCHRPGPGGVGFQPQDFASDCQRCHQLDTSIGTQALRLPHGDSDAVRALLVAADLTAVQAPEPENSLDSERRRRPGDRADQDEGVETLSNVDEVFERRVCGKCHEIERGVDHVVAVRLPDIKQSWMPFARFTHEPHRWVSCDTCHSATTSSSAEQLLLPKIKTCQGCHGGIDSAHAVQSTCIDCHRFHQAETEQMGKSKGTLAHGAIRGGEAK